MIDKVIVLSQAKGFIKRLEQIDLNDPELETIIDFAQATYRFFAHVEGEESDYAGEMDSVAQDAERFDAELKSPEEDEQRLEWKQKLYDRIRGALFVFGRMTSRHGLPPGYRSPKRNLLISNAITFAATAAGLGLVWYFSSRNGDSSVVDKAAQKLRSWR